MNMNSIFKELFKPIHAKEELKNQTIAFLAERTQGYKRQAVQKMTMREIRDLIDCLSTDKENNSSSYNNRQNGHHRHGGGGWTKMEEMETTPRKLQPIQICQH